MPAEAGDPFAIHATAVAIGDKSLLIRGVSHAGKSRLALALIARGTPRSPIRLLGDDRILLHRVADGLMARPHPRIAGFIERRGLGLVAMPWVSEALVAGVVELSQFEPEPFDRPAQGNVLASLRSWPHDASWDAGLPTLVLTCALERERVERVLAWWAGMTAAWAPHRPEKADDAALAYAKD